MVGLLIVGFVISVLLATMNFWATNTFPRCEQNVFMLEDEHVPFRFSRMRLFTMWIWD